MTRPRLNAIIELRTEPDGSDEWVLATPEAIEQFIKRVIADDRRLRFLVNKRLRDGLVAPIQKDDLDATKAYWDECAAKSAMVLKAEYDQQHAALLRGLVCNATDNRKEIAAGIIRNWIPISQSRDALPPYRDDYSPRLARGLLGLDGQECAATKDLSDKHKELLQGYASTPAPAN